MHLKFRKTARSLIRVCKLVWRVHELEEHAMPDQNFKNTYE